MKTTNYFIFAFCLLGIIFNTELQLADIAMASSALFVSALVTHYSVGRLKSRFGSLSSAIAIGIIIYYWIAYMLKSVVFLYLPEAAWVVPNLIDENTLKNSLARSLVISSVGYSVLLLAICTGRDRQAINWKLEPFQVKCTSLVLITCCVLFLKVLGKIFFKLGIPSVEPTYMGVPYLAGALALVVEIGVFILVNVFLFIGIFSRKHSVFLFSLVLAFSNALIDLSFGSKDGIIYQAIVLLVYVFLVLKFSPKGHNNAARTHAKMTFVFSIFLLLLIVVFYKYVNFFRFALLGGSEDIGQAMQLALAHETARSRSSILEIFNRLNGSEILSTVLYYSEQISFEFRAVNLIDGNLTREFTAIVMGVRDTNTSFGITQFGYFFISGGYIALIMGCFLLGKMFVIVQNFLYQFKTSTSVKIACLPLLWILFLKVLLGAGNLVLFAKEVVVFLICYYFIIKILQGKYSRYKGF